MFKMSVDLKLLDQFRLTDHLSRNFACGLSEDNRIFIISNIGVYIISFNGNVTNPFKTFSCLKSVISASHYSPSANVDLDINSFLKECDRKDLYEVVMSTEYSSNIKHANPIDPLPITAEWSPKGIIEQTGCLIAVLTNLNSLEIYSKRLNTNELVEYNSSVNISEKVIQEEKKHWTNTTRFRIEIKLSEFRRRVDKVASTAFAWTHTFEVNGVISCAILVGHLNGDITVHRISRNMNTEDLELDSNYLGRYTTKLNRITTMHWHPTSAYSGGLSFADVDGKMSVLHVTKLNEDKFCIEKELAFWKEPDKVLVEKITVMNHEDLTYILIVKQRVLIIYGIDKNGEVFDTKAIHIEDYFITGIHHTDNIILVLSLTGILTQITLSIEDNKIMIVDEKIPLKVDMSPYRTHGFCFSKNKTLLFLLNYPWGFNSKYNPSLVHVFIFQNMLVKPFDVLYGNDRNSLSNYWDCFETLRLTCLKEKRFPWLGLPANLNYDKLSLVQLKTLRLIAKMSEMVFDQVEIVKTYDIKPYIIIHYLVEIKLILRRMNKLLNLIKSGKELSLFQWRSMDIQIFFLKEMVAKNILAKANVGEKFVTEMTKVLEIANELKYPDMMQCVWCGEKIIGPLCVPPHADSRCSVSMMPIFIVPSYKCPYCKCLVHREIEKEETIIVCPYCDIVMEKIPVDYTKYEKLAKDCKVDSFGEVRSMCFDDCLKDEELSDIEENNCEYVIFSDSEDEIEEQEQLKTLYFRLSKMNLDEIINLETTDSDEAGPSKIIKIES